LRQEARLERKEGHPSFLPSAGFEESQKELMFFFVRTGWQFE
jgi:hypothetical protein